MNAEHDLIEAYDEWRRLANLVGQGIADGDWEGVDLNQRAIRELQKRISRLSPPVRVAWAQADPHGMIKAANLNQVIDDLMIQARSQQTLIMGKKQIVRQKLEQTGAVVRNLKRLRNSYVVSSVASRPGRRTAWA